MPEAENKKETNLCTSDFPIIEVIRGIDWAIFRASGYLDGRE